MATKSSASISENRSARHDFELGEQFEAGLVLLGWEIKSIRAGRSQVKDSYVQLIHEEAWLVGAHISPLITASTHVDHDPTRFRKLLLTSKELAKIKMAVQAKGMTIVPLRLYWKKQNVKLKISLGRGKKNYDKRHSIKERDLKRRRERE